nr:MAG TPA: hypothetical protein [Caudoviricetes sp.]
MKYLKLKKQIEVLEARNEFLEFKSEKLSSEIARLEAMGEFRAKINKELTQEVASLKAELEKKDKEPVAFTISMDKENVDDIVKKVTENVLGKQEHKCTEVCFKKHVLNPIQSDIYSKFGNDDVTRSENLDEMIWFTEKWRIRLTKEYPFLKDLYTMNFGDLTAVYK